MIVCTIELEIPLLVLLAELEIPLFAIVIVKELNINTRALSLFNFDSNIRWPLEFKNWTGETAYSRKMLTKNSISAEIMVSSHFLRS